MVRIFPTVAAEISVRFFEPLPIIMPVSAVRGLGGVLGALLLILERYSSFKTGAAAIVGCILVLSC